MGWARPWGSALRDQPVGALLLLAPVPRSAWGGVREVLCLRINALLSSGCFTLGDASRRGSCCRLDGAGTPRCASIALLQAFGSCSCCRSTSGLCGAAQGAVTAAQQHLACVPPHPCVPSHPCSPSDRQPPRTMPQPGAALLSPVFNVPIYYLFPLLLQFLFPNLQSFLLAPTPMP